MDKNQSQKGNPFTARELIALKLFYSRVPAKQIREKYCDPWRLVAKHRNLPQPLFLAVKAEVDQIPIPDFTQ